MKFLEAQKLVVKILKCVGFFAYGIDNIGDNIDYKLRVFFCIVINTFSHVFLLGVHITFTLQVENYLSDDNAATQLVTYLEGLAVEVSSFFIFYGILFCKKSQVEFFRTVTKLEEEIRQLKMTRGSYNEALRMKSKLEVVGEVLIHVGIIILYSFIVPRDKFFIFMIETVNFVAFSLYLILVTQFMNNAVKTLGNLFDELERNLQHFVSPCPFHFHDGELKKVFAIHDKLIETIPLFNESFGVIALAIFIYNFGMVAFELYFGFSLIFSSSPALFNLNLFLNVFSNILTFIPLLLTFCNFGFTCESVQEKV